MEDTRLKEKYDLSVFCHTLTRGDEAIVCHTGNGMNIKIPLACWEVIDKYLQHYTPYEICEAADEEDRSYFREIFEWLIEKKVIVREGDEKLDTVDMVITNRCNLQCTHCCASAETAIGEDPLSTEEWLKIIDKVLEANPREITITGGEPMLREDFWIITNYIKERYQGKMGLMTNGLLITSQNVKRLIDTYHSISISLDGYDEETCSKIRGKGVFSRILESISILVENGFVKENLSASMVETSVTYGERDKFEELCQNLGVKPMVRIFSAVGRGATNSDWLSVLDNEQILEEQKIMREVYKNRKNGLPICQNCNAGRTKIAIDHKGEIYPCITLNKEKYCLGNALEISNIMDFVIKNKYQNCIDKSEFENILVQNRDKCSKCDIAPFCIYCVAEFEQEVEQVGIKKICEKNKYLREIIWS